MTDRPIALTAAEVQRILGGTQTKLTRLLDPQPYIVREEGGRRMWNASGCVGGRISSSDGDLLDLHRFPLAGSRAWVREHFTIGEDLGADWEDWMARGDHFVAASAQPDQRYCVPDTWEAPRGAKAEHHQRGTAEHWREWGPFPASRMPRWASRITLAITGARVQRLQDMSPFDAKANGIAEQLGGWFSGAEGQSAPDPRAAFAVLWNSLHKRRQWNANPWVCVLTFTADRRNIDAKEPA